MASSKIVLRSSAGRRRRRLCWVGFELGGVEVVADCEFGRSKMGEVMFRRWCVLSLVRQDLPAKSNEVARYVQVFVTRDERALHG